MIENLSAVVFKIAVSFSNFPKLMSLILTSLGFLPKEEPKAENAEP
jgi:hypothetical protein